MIIILLLLFIPTLILGDSTGTVADLTPPTTYQILLDKVVTGSNEDKLAALSELLNDTDYYESMAGIKIDKETGQLLLNNKTYLKRVVRNKELGKNYISYIDYRKYEVK